MSGQKGQVTAAIIAELVVQREKDGLYVDDDHDAKEMMVDGFVNIEAVAEATIKAVAGDFGEDADLAGEWTNGLATIELTRQHIDRALIGTVWEAIQRDAVFGTRHLVVTPAGLRDAGYRRVGS